MGAPSHIRADGSLRGGTNTEATLDTTIPITATIKRFSEISGIGRSIVYKLLADGSLESLHIGKRRLIVIDSYHELIKRKRADREK
jgi:hypothetical protein